MGAFPMIVKLQTSRRFVSSSTDHKAPDAGLTITSQLQWNKRSVATNHSHYTDTLIQGGDLYHPGVASKRLYFMLYGREKWLGVFYFKSNK